MFISDYVFVFYIFIGEKEVMMAKKKVAKKKTVSRKKHVSIQNAPSEKKRGMGLAIVSLILNVMFWPGLGSLVGMKTREGIWQVILFIAGASLGAYAYFYSWSLFLLSLGGVLAFAAWVWGLITGIVMIQEARK